MLSDRESVPLVPAPPAVWCAADVVKTQPYTKANGIIVA